MPRIDSWIGNTALRAGRSFSIAAGMSVLLAMVGVVLATPASAGGLYANEFATSSQGNAGAGRGAWTPDASVALHNPASMTDLDDHGLAGGLALAFGNVHFDTESTSPSGTGNGGNQAGIAPIASASYVHKISDRVRFGFSFYSISGSILNPSNDWGGRFELTNVALLTVSLSPTLAVRVTDWLSIGAGPLISYGNLNWDLKVALPPGSESAVRQDNLDDWQAAARVGVLLKPTDDFNLSIYYNSKTDFELDGRIEGPVGANPDLDVNLPLAQFVEVGAHWQVNDEIALLATFDWEDWSEADGLKVTVAGATTNVTTGFRDTYKFGIGANYRLSDVTTLQTGLMYDTSALKNKDRSTALPIDDQIRFALGMQRRLSDGLNLGLSFVYLNLGQGEVRNATVRGDYKRNHAFIFGIALAFDHLPWSSKPYVKSKG